MLRSQCFLLLSHTSLDPERENSGTSYWHGQFLLIALLLYPKTVNMIAAVEGMTGKLPFLPNQ